jgi:ACT domain-containing protein
MSDDRHDMLKRAETRWMSVEDATITVSARALSELGRDWKAAEAEVTRLLEALREIEELRDLVVGGGSFSAQMREIARAARSSHERT